MKVLLAISEAPPLRSGVARTGQRLVEGWRAAGHEVETLTEADTGRAILGEARLTGTALRLPSIARRLREADVVSLHGPAPTFSDALLLLGGALRWRGRLVYTHHFDIDFPRLAPLSGVYMLLHRALARLADAVVVTTPSYAARLAGVRRVTVVPWAADSRFFQQPGARPERFTALFVGQLRPYKSVDTLIRAAALAPDVRVRIAGDGPERAALERLARRIGAGNVEFLGGVSDEALPSLYAQAHAVVLPSKSRLEAFGIVLLEGMAAGCVPIASDLPGPSDVVSDAGYTFPTGDAKALARLLSELAEDRERWQRRSERSRDRAGGYSWERTVQGYLDVFAAVRSPVEAVGELGAQPEARP